MLPSQLMLTIAPLSFLTENGKQQPIHSIRIEGIQNVNDSILLNANATICHDTCEFITAKQYKPLASGIFAFYTPIVDHWLNFQITINNNTFEIHPAGTSIAKLVASHLVPPSLQQQFRDLNHFQKHNNTNHLEKRSKQHKFDTALQYHDHDPVSYKSTLFKINHVGKRSVQSGLHDAFNAVATALSHLGHSFLELCKKIMLLFDWHQYLNVMEFMKYFIDNVYYTIRESMPIVQSKMMHWINDVKFNKNLNTSDSEKHAKLASNVTMTGKEEDPRTLFIKDHTLRNIDPHALKTTLKDAMEPSLVLGKSAISNLNTLLPIAPSNDKHTLFRQLRMGTLNAFGNVSSDTFNLTKPFHATMMRLMNAKPPMLLSPVALILSRFIFKNRFDISLMNIFLVIAAMQFYFIYVSLYQQSPITNADLTSIKKSPHIMNVMHVWLKDPVSGTPNPSKEYRIRCLLDWMPKQITISVLEVIVLELVVMPIPQETGLLAIVPQILYVFQTFLIALAVFPLDFIESQSITDINRQLGEIYTPYYVMWYLWNLTCMWHVLRPFFVALDMFQKGQMIKAVKNIVPNSIINKMGNSPFKTLFDKVKALLMGIPQIFCISGMIHDLKSKIHFNNPVQTTHFALNSFSWWMDTMTMVNPLFYSVDAWVEKTILKGIVGTMDYVYTYGMLGGYFMRTLFMEANGIPGVFLYYKSYFLTANNVSMQQQQVNTMIPPKIQRFMSINDPSSIHKEEEDDVKMKKGKEIREEIN